MLGQCQKMFWKQDDYLGKRYLPKQNLEEMKNLNGQEIAGKETLQRMILKDTLGLNVPFHL